MIFMGGRGASSGISDKGKKYGTEYKSLLYIGRKKFVRATEGAAKAPLETRTKGRIYVTVNNQDKIKSISFYDRKNKRRRQIDVSGNPHRIDGKLVLPHVHKGYLHNEKGDRTLTPKEVKLVARVLRIWNNRK